MTYLYCDETGFAMFEVSSTSSPSASYVVVAKNALTGQSSIDSNEVLVVFATTTKQDDLSTLRTVAAVGLCVAAAPMLGNVVLFTMHIKGKKAAA